MADLYRVTITGADDLVDPNALLDLSAEFPFVEWGILRSETRFGESRYPSHSWWAQWSAAQQSRAPRWYPWAVHLCGKLSRLAMGGRVLPFLWQINNPVRIQLNGFSNYSLPSLVIADDMRRTEFILQVGDEVAFSCAERLRQEHPNSAPLLDASGGRGVAIDFKPRTSRHVGYAGRLGPDNVVAAIKAFRDGHRETRFWIDMESGVRTEDRFDLAKVRTVLELAAPYVTRAEATNG